MESFTSVHQIIVIEDDYPLTNLIKKNLSRLGYEVDVALRGDEGMAKILSGKDYSMLVLDYNLPDMNGQEFILKLTEKNYYLPYIVISGASDIKNAVEMTKLGAYDYLVKDLNFIALLPTVINRVADEVVTRKKLVETELALNKSEEQTTIFKSFAEAAGQGFGIADLDNRMNYLNPAFYDLIKIPKTTEVESLFLTDFFPAEDKDRLLNDVLPVVKRTGQWTGEIRLVNHFNETIDTIQNLFIIKDLYNIPRYIAGIVTDITLRKKSEETMKLQSTTLEASANSIVITNKNGEILWINPAFTKLTGYDKDEVLYKNINILKSGMHNQVFYSGIWEVVNRGEVWQGEIVNRRKNGELYHEEQTVTPVFDDKGEIINFISIKQDITHRKHIEEELRKINEELEKRIEERTSELKDANKALKESEEKFRTLFQASSDAVLLMEDRKIYEWNHAALAMFRVSEDMIKSKSFCDFSPEYQPDGNRSVELENYHFNDALNSGSAKFEWVHQINDQIYLVADISLTSIKIGDKNICQAVIRDITEKRRAQEALRETQAMLLQSEKMAALGEMVASVAHEINTPIGIGVTAASHLDEKTKNLVELFDQNLMKKSDLLNYVTSAGNTTASILSNLKRAADLVKSFKQVAIDQSSEEIRTFNVLNYLDEILLSLKPKLKKTNHTIKIECSDNIEIKSFPGAFAQIITNFIMNSLIHGFEKIEAGNIIISVKNEENLLTLIYQDDGKGIPVKDIKKIYEPFFTTKKEKGGTGLGLNIVYNIVTQQLNGKIDCDSLKDKGVKFTVEIPIN